MSKQRILELIRKEEIALFAGAGMSLYAGYPSGEALAEIIYNKLTADLKEQIEFSKDLPKLANDIYNIKGGNKNYLIEMLKNEFEKDPKTKKTHEILSKIPQIKTIITTNYDTLFEITNKNLQIIRNSVDCANANLNKQCLFKIHGDLNDTSNIILTKSDYSNYFVKENEQSIFWNTVKTKLIENHIIFVGYNLEDINIINIIEKIKIELGDSSKEMYLVAPSIKPAKLIFLQKKGIKYIEATAEELFKEVEEDLKNNYFPELVNGNGKADTAFDFARINNINIGLSKPDKFYVIDRISSLNGYNENKLNFKIEGEKESTKKIIDSLNGKDFDDVLLTGDLLKEYSHFFNGIRINNQKNITSLYIKKVPSIFGMFTFLFEDGFELDNYYLEIFIANPNENQTNMKIIVADFEISIGIDFTLNSEKHKFRIKIELINPIKSVKNGLNFYNILSRIVSNKKFKMFKENKIIFNYKENIFNDKFAFDADFLIKYFYNLRKIENYFDVTFTDIKLEEVNPKNLKFINSYIDKIDFQKEFNGMTFKNNNKEEFNYLIKEENKDKVLIFSDEQISVYNLHGINLSIGYLHKYIKDAYIENLQDLIDKKTEIFDVKSKSNKIYYKFNDNKKLIS